MSHLMHPIEPEELMAYVDGELPADRASTVRTHVDGCADCTAAESEMRQLSMKLASWEVEPGSDRLAATVLAELRKPVEAKPERKPAPRRNYAWALGFGGAFAAVLLVIFTANQGLRSRRHSAGAFPEAANGPVATEAGKVGKLELALPQSQPSSPRGPAGPMVIRTVDLTIVAPDLDSARSKIDSIVQQLGGYVDRLAIEGQVRSARTLQATLRLPSNQVESGVTELKKLGQVRKETQGSLDVSGEYVDLVARLTNARNTEQRLLALMRDRTGDLKDVVEVEREIARVREEVERMEAQRKGMDNKVQFATIQLELTEEYRAQLGQTVPSTQGRLQNALVEGYGTAVESTLAATLVVLTYGPVLLLWSAFVASVIWIVRFGRTRLRQ